MFTPQYYLHANFLVSILAPNVMKTDGSDKNRVKGWHSYCKYNVRLQFNYIVSPLNPKNLFLFVY